ncbi:MAG: 2,3-cyclic phosphodiesterase [Caulobacteraceae bacterium]|nr:2,3-cyclic phosphodiesterase [Caulobacteraceae bacterium]
MIRLFAAIAAPETLAETLARLQAGVEGARWRPPGALHVTLRFFGDIPENLADDLDEELQAVEGEPFDAALKGVGAFGEGRNLRAIWAGVEESAPLRRLAGRCEAAARRAGLRPETRNYTPHVTLAYLRGVDEGEVAAWIQRHNLFRTPPFAVDRFGLYSSWTGRSGSAYRREREYPLR